MSRAFLYGRHSTIHQQMTEQAQRHHCLAYYEAYLRPEGVELAGEGWYYDPAESGGLPFGERTNGRVVLASIQPTDWLVFADWTRAFRDNLDSELTMRQLLDRRVNVHCTQFPISTARAVGRYMQRVVAATSQFERESASERVLEVNAQKRRDGIPFSRGVPMGWKAVRKGKDGRLTREYVIDLDERALCDVVAARRQAGESHERIAMWLHLQKTMKNKRGSDRTTVVWMLQARAAGYPKITGYKTIRKMVKAGQLPS